MQLADGVSRIEIEGVGIEVAVRGTGKPLLFLHPEIGIDPAAPVLAHLAKKAQVIAPSHPGFGHSELPRAMNSVEDLGYFYLDFLDALDLKDAILVGASLGGWIAAAITVKSTARFSHLVLAASVGIKAGDREHRDIADIFATTEPQFAELAYFDPAAAKRDLTALPEAELVTIARNREATARFAWSPYMHDPKLKGRLHRIRIPSLVLWGASDRIAAADYGRALAGALPGARFELIERAGHYPHLEQPEQFARKILAFTGLAESAP